MRFLSKLFKPAKTNQFVKSSTTSIEQATTTFGVEDLTMGDFNGDGILDFAITRMDFTSVGSNAVRNQVYLGAGKNKFVESSSTVFSQIPTTNYASKTIARDFNNDGITDLLYVDTGIDKEPFTGGKNKFLMSVNGKLTDISSTVNQTAQNNHGVSIGDVNKDGKLDVLTNSFQTQNTVGGDTLYLNTGNSFTVANNIMPKAGAIHYSSGLVDVNRDGMVDLIVGGTSYTDTTVFLNKNGTFNTSIPMKMPKSGVANEAVLDIDVINLNNDKWPDLVLTMINEANYKTPYLQFLTGDGKGNFIDKTSTYMPQSKVAGVDGAFIKYTDVIDLNHDGKMDLVTHGINLKSSVFMNDGRTFTKIIETPNDWDRLALGDVNKDGKTDFIVTNPYANGVDTYLNTMVDYAIHVNPIGIAPYDPYIGIF